MAISTAAVHVAKHGFRTEEPSSDREIKRLIDTLIDGIKTLIDGDELVAEFSIHSPYLAAVLVNAFTKIGLNTVDANGEPLLNAVDTDSEALLNSVDTEIRVIDALGKASVAG
jgi:hypothetical protein